MPRHKESAIHKYFKYDEDMNESICQVRNREKGKICNTIIKVCTSTVINSILLERKL